MVRFSCRRVSLSSAEASLYRRKGLRREPSCYVVISSLKIIMFSGLRKNICLKESEDWCKVISNKIFVTFVTQGLPSFFPARRVA